MNSSKDRRGYGRPGYLKSTRSVEIDNMGLGFCWRLVVVRRLRNHLLKLISCKGCNNNNKKKKNKNNNYIIIMSDNKSDKYRRVYRPQKIKQLTLSFLFLLPSVRSSILRNAQHLPTEKSEKEKQTITHIGIRFRGARDDHEEPQSSQSMNFL